MRLNTRKCQLPIKHLLLAEYSNAPLDFSLICNNQEFKFNSYFLSLISETISELFISNPLEYQYKFTLKNISPEQIPQIIQILTIKSYKINESNYKPCFDLALILRSSHILKYIADQYTTKLNNLEVLFYSVAAYRKSMIIPHIFKKQLARYLKEYFLAGLLVEISQDEIFAISMAEEEDQIENPNSEFIFELPEFCGILPEFGEMPPGLLYDLFSEFSEEIHPKIRKHLIIRYTGVPPVKHRYLVPFVATTRTPGSKILSYLQGGNFNYLRDFYVRFNKSRIQKPKLIPNSNLIEFFRFNGIMKNFIRPTINSFPPISAKYSIMNIFRLDDSCYKCKLPYHSILFHFSPHKISLSKMILIDPPKEWDLLTKKNGKILVLASSKTSPPSSERIHIISINSNESHDNLAFITERKDQPYEFSLTYIDFI